MENTHVIEYRGDRRECNPETYEETLEALIEKHGEPNGEVPKVTELGDSLPGNRSLSGKFRAEADEITALDNGFSPAPPLYRIGTKVNSWGVDNARASQQKHDEKPKAKDLASALVEQVRAEDRRDLPAVAVRDLRMSGKGFLVLPGANGQPGTGNKFVLNRASFNQLINRFPCEAPGRYLASCPTRLRSINLNHWAENLAEREALDPKKDASQTVLRVRGQNEVFASVSPTYTAFDADKIGLALQRALPDDARGSLDYNGSRTRLEALWHTDVAPEEFVAGEFFKAGVIVRADDTGGGSIRVQSVIWRNLCLNLIILDQAVGVDIKINHVGSVEKLAYRFRQAFTKALGSVEPFRRSWGRAMAERDEKLVERVQGTTSEDLSTLPVSAVLPGLFNGILDRDLVKVPGRRKEVVPQLLEMHSQDEAAGAYGVSRASVVNAFTRYAHTVEADPFVADEIRAGAGRLLAGKGGREPAPLPYAPITLG